MRPGTRVKLKIDGIKRKGTIVGMDVRTSQIDVTSDGSIEGVPPDTYRRFVPGRTSVTLVIELDKP